MWIPVSERLPEKGAVVQVCVEREGKLCTTAAMEDHGEWYGFRGRLDVLFWQPLADPPPPEEPRSGEIS